MASSRACFNDIRFFVPCFGFLVLTDVMGEVMKTSTQTSIERRFHLTSTATGLLASSYYIGSLTTVLFASYFGARWHRPRMMFYGSVLMVIGYLIIPLPHFLGERYEYEDISSNTTSPKMSRVSECSVTRENSTVEEDSICKDLPTNNLYVLLLVGIMVTGVGGSALNSLGVSYVDDFAHERNSPLYLSITTTMSLLGPMIGFAVSSVVLRMWVDIGWVDISTITITPTHPSWVGAWWLGFLVCAAGIAVSMIPFYFFPKKMDKQHHEEAATARHVLGTKGNLKKRATVDERVEVNETDEADISCQEIDKKTSLWSREKKKISHILKSLATNHLYHLILLKMYLGHGVLVGVVYFFPKYLEVGFGVSASKANLLTGVVNVPCVAAGTLLAGFTMRYFDLSTVGASKLIAAATILGTLCMAPLIFIGCETIAIGGITAPYNDRPSDILPSVQNKCNEDCRCLNGSYAPVCGSDGISYVSPCHAGCSEVQYDGVGLKQNFTKCSCIKSEVDIVSWAKSERCQLSKCGELVTVVLALKSAAGLFVGLATTPLYIIMLRSVEADQKTIAFAVYLVVIRVFAWIPGPVVYGSIIDSACLYWGKKPCEDQAYCKVYDNTAYRHRFFGSVVCCNVLSCLVATALCYTLKKRQRAEKKSENDNQADYVSETTQQEQMETDGV